MSENKMLLQMKHIRKSFPGVLVLDDVDFEVGYGEVHGLMGENGAGKSTLIKILTGIHPCDEGTIVMDGREVQIHNKHDAAACGISVIYQELSLIPTLTVVENIFLGQEMKSGRLFLNRKAMRARAQELVEKCHFDIDLDEPVENLSVAKQQTVEILKSLLMNAKLIIMDEPTASLNIQESESLFEIIRNLKSQGTSIIYISHRLEEIWNLADRLTILRDGKVRGVLDRADIDPARVVHMMIGKELKEETPEIHEPLEGGSVLKVDGLSTPELLDRISFEVRGGQILGIGGLVGAGRTELLECIYGLRKYSEGSITLNGTPVAATAGKARKQGIGLVPEDRRVQGLVQILPITDNVALPNYDVLFKSFHVNPGKIEAAAEEEISRLRIKTPDGFTKCMNLSGGNQQKVVLAKWMLTQPDVLILDEPTRGIDVGAKYEIYEVINELAASGKAVIVISSDMQEIIGTCDRTYVLNEGEICGELSGDEITQENIMGCIMTHNNRKGAAS